MTGSEDRTGCEKAETGGLYLQTSDADDCLRVLWAWLRRPRPPDLPSASWRGLPYGPGTVPKVLQSRAARVWRRQWEQPASFDLCHPSGEEDGRPEALNRSTIRKSSQHVLFSTTRSVLRSMIWCSCGGSLPVCLTMSRSHFVFCLFPVDQTFLFCCSDTWFSNGVKDVDVIFTVLQMRILTDYFICCAVLVPISQEFF